MPAQISIEELASGRAFSECAVIRALLRKAGPRMLPVPLAEGSFDSELGPGVGSIGGLCVKKGILAGIY